MRESTSDHSKPQNAVPAREPEINQCAGGAIVPTPLPPSYMKQQGRSPALQIGGEAGCGGQQPPGAALRQATVRGGGGQAAVPAGRPAVSGPLLLPARRRPPPGQGRNRQLPARGAGAAVMCQCLETPNSSRSLPHSPQNAAPSQHLKLRVRACAELPTQRGLYVRERGEGGGGGGTPSCTWDWPGTPRVPPTAGSARGGPGRCAAPRGDRPPGPPS